MYRGNPMRIHLIYGYYLPSVGGIQIDINNLAREFTNKGHEVLVQSNGGFEAGFSNEDYKNAGAKIIDNAEEIFEKSEIIVKVKEPQMNEVKLIRENQIIYTYLHFCLFDIC